MAKIKKQRNLKFWYGGNCNCRENIFPNIQKAIEHYDNCKQCTDIYYENAFGAASHAWPDRREDKNGN